MFIQEAELFKGIASHIIDEIADIAVEEVLPAGHRVFENGDFADSLYVLEEGAIDIVIEGKRRMSFSVNQQADVFGWSALVEPRRYKANAECAKESHVIKIDGDRLMRVFERHPSEGLSVMKRLTGVVASRLVKSYQDIKASGA